MKSMHLSPHLSKHHKSGTYARVGAERSFIRVLPLSAICPAKFRKIKAKPVALVWNLSLFMQQEISALIQVWCLLPPNLLSAGPQGWDALGCMNAVSPHGLQSDWRMHNSVPEFKDGTGWWSSLQGSWTARCQHVLHWHLNSLNWGLPAH